MKDYINKVIKGYGSFENEELIAFNDINTFGLSPINIFRVKNKFLLKDTVALRNLKNVRSIPATNDLLYVFLIDLKSGKRFLLAIADPIELWEDPYLIGQQQL